MKMLGVILVGIVVLLQFPDGGDAECCPPPTDEPVDVPWRCNDGTVPTPCCGYGKCNIFCCNCDGGCRSGRRSSVLQPPLEVLAKRSSNGHDVVARGDLDGDGMMSLEEGLAHLDHLDDKEFVKRSLREMDMDGDGFLSPEEIDPSMSQHCPENIL